jgi:hypothetical protein
MRVPMKLRTRVAAEKTTLTPRERAIPLIQAGMPGPRIAAMVGVSNSAIKKCASFFLCVCACFRDTCAVKIIYFCGKNKIQEHGSSVTMVHAVCQLKTKTNKTCCQANSQMKVAHPAQEQHPAKKEWWADLPQRIRRRDPPGLRGRGRNEAQKLEHHRGAKKNLRAEASAGAHGRPMLQTTAQAHPADSAQHLQAPRHLVHPQT